MYAVGADSSAGFVYKESSVGTSYADGLIGAAYAVGLIGAHNFIGGVYHNRVFFANIYVNSICVYDLNIFIRVYLYKYTQVYITWFSFQYAKLTLLACPEQLGVGQGDSVGRA